MTGLGTIPADWDVHTLDEVSVKIQDGTHFSPTLGGNEYRYITSRNIGYGRLRLDSVEMISESEHRKIYRRCDTRFGDLLLTKDGANTGNAAINSFTDEISLLSSVAFVRADHRRATERYLLQYLLSGPGRRQIEDAMAGNAITRLTLAKIKALRVPMPRVEQQQRIAAALGDADDLIAGFERMLAKKRAVKQGMLQQLLSGHTRLPGFSEPWSHGTFEELAFPAAERSMPTDVSATTPLVDLEQIEGGSGRLLATSQAADAVSLKAVFRPGDVLFGKLRAYLRKYWYANVAGLCTTEIWVLRATPAAHGRFIRYVVETEHFIDVASGAYGTHMPRSDWGTVRLLPVAIPPKDEQIAIASVLQDADRDIEVLHRRLEKAVSIKRGMMEGLLSGRTHLPVSEIAE